MRQGFCLAAVVVACAVASGGCSDSKTAKPSSEAASSVAAEDPAAVMEAAATKRLLEATRRELKDPESAQFRELHYFNPKLVTADGKRLSTGVHVLCGEINAKNSMGGYVGFVEFVSSEVEGKSEASVVAMTKPSYDSKAERDFLERPFRKAKSELCVQTLP